jgi:hypothetical protein
LLAAGAALAIAAAPAVSAAAGTSGNETFSGTIVFSGVPGTGRSPPAWCAPEGCSAGTSRQTVRRPELAGWANYGYCAAHSCWYWGLKLYLMTTAEGMPVAWCLADPKLGGREVAAELLAHARDVWTLPASPATTRGGEPGSAPGDGADLRRSLDGRRGRRLVRGAV